MPAEAARVYAVTMPITCLHISDLHFQSEGDLFSQDQVCDALLRSVHEIVRNGIHAPTLAMVTGDIAYSGRKSEYEKAASFFERLTSNANIERSAVFFVPGNHDIDRSKHELSYYGAKNRIDSIRRVDDYLADSDKIRSLLHRQSAFWAFIDEFTSGQHRTHSADGLGYVSRVNLERPTICIWGLNSAWLSGDSEESGTLAIGERQIINCSDLSSSHDPHLTIALVHHPISHLAEWDANSCHSRLLPAVDVLLRGHLHSPQVLLSSTPESPCIEIAAGSSHTTRFETNSYNIVTIDPASGTCEVHCYQYRHENASFVVVGTRAANVSLRGSWPGSRSDLAGAIRRAIPEATSFGDFMAGLLVGELSEIPISADGSVMFVSPTVASELVDEISLRSIVEFLGLRNLLRLYDPAVSLDARVTENASVIRQLARNLTKMVSEDPSCIVRLQGDQSSSTTRLDQRGSQRWSVDLISDLRRSEDWDELELLARELKASPDPVVGRVASASLAEALMHSDESQKRQEALTIALELVSTGSPSAHEIILAAAAAEVLNDDARAVELIQDALRSGVSGLELVDYARDLSLRTGNRDLRQLAQGMSPAAYERGEA